MWELLKKNPRYLRYWVSLLGTEFAEWIRNMVLTYIVYDLSGGSAKAVSAILLCEFIPVFAGPFIGVLTDRWNRQRTFLISVTTQGVLLIGIGIATSKHLLILLFIGALLSAGATVFSQSAAAGYLLQFVEENRRKDATALQQIVVSLMMLLGPPLGTAVYVALQGQGALILAGALFLVAVALNLTIRVPHVAHGKDSQFTYWHDLKNGVGYAKSHWIMRFIIIVAMLLGCSAGMLNVLEIFLVTSFLHLPKTWLSILLFVQGGGMLLSTPLLNRVKIPMTKLLSFSLLWFGTGMGLMVVMRQWWLTLIGYLVFSVGNVAANLAIGTLMKTQVEDSYQGRMSSLFNTAYGVMTGLFMVITGQLQELLGVQILIGLNSALILISGLVLLGIASNRFRRQTAKKQRKSPGEVDL